MRIVFSEHAIDKDMVCTGSPFMTLLVKTPGDPMTDLLQNLKEGWPKERFAHVVGFQNIEAYGKPYILAYGDFYWEQNYND